MGILIWIYFAFLFGFYLDLFGFLFPNINPYRFLGKVRYADIGYTIIASSGASRPLAFIRRESRSRPPFGKSRVSASHMRSGPIGSPSASALLFLPQIPRNKKGTSHSMAVSTLSRVPRPLPNNPTGKGTWRRTARSVYHVVPAKGLLYVQDYSIIIHPAFLSRSPSFNLSSYSSCPSFSSSASSLPCCSSVLPS